jgi:hypothetical protein
MKSRLVWNALVLGLLLLSTSMWSSAENELGDFRERVKVYWEARVKGDFAVLYDFHGEAQKEQLSRDEYVNASKETFPFRVLSYKLGAAEMDGDIAWVNVSYSAALVKYSNLPPRELQVLQVWIKSNGSWRPVPQEHVDNFPKPPRLRAVAEEPVLTKRAEGYWEAREKQDLARIYEYCDPQFRGRIPRDQFLQKTMGYFYLSHRIEWVEAIGNNGRVKVTYFVRPNDPAMSKLTPIEETKVERWVKMEGEWYRHITGNEGEQ